MFTSIFKTLTKQKDRYYTKEHEHELGLELSRNLKNESISKNLIIENGSLWSVNGPMDSDVRCILEEASITVNELFFEIKTEFDYVKYEWVFVVDFQRHISDAVQFKYKRGKELGILFDSHISASQFSLCYSQYLLTLQMVTEGIVRLYTVDENDQSEKPFKDETLECRCVFHSQSRCYYMLIMNNGCVELYSNLTRNKYVSAIDQTISWYEATSADGNKLTAVFKVIFEEFKIYNEVWSQIQHSYQTTYFQKYADAPEYNMDNQSNSDELTETKYLYDPS